MLAILHEYAGVSLGQILAIALPSFFMAAIVAALSVYKRGKELEDDPRFQRRVAVVNMSSCIPRKKNMLLLRAQKRGRYLCDWGWCWF